MLDNLANLTPTERNHYMSFLCAQAQAELLARILELAVWAKTYPPKTERLSENTYSTRLPALPYSTATVSIPVVGILQSDVPIVYNERGLTSITDVRCACEACGWAGTVGDTESDVDGDGELLCPQCRAVINVRVPKQTGDN